ncbi:hypothetical protein [Bordetella genomosp. 1]|uniref:hypothetical protein n=1 Tax=Bordetella genomosp. 1 TaxID=1395607 RepID=UPI001140A2E1|nr:hypothetical protein [Bordetella genomosp. 1]
MAEILIRAASPADAFELAPVMRPADRAEIDAAQGQGACYAEAVRSSIVRSSAAWTAHINGEIAMIGGVAPLGTLLTGNVGSPWLLGSTAMFRRPGALTRTARRYVAFMHQTYPELVNYVDARNVVSIAWLQRLGFEVRTDAPIPYGPDGVPFFRFTKKV